MKRVGFLFEKVADIENIKLAIKNSSRGKRRKKYVMRVYRNPERYARILQRMILTKNIPLGQNRRKSVYDQSSRKQRDITVPKYFPDQVLHWAVIQVLSPVIMRGMYRYCCGSVPGRGGMAVKKKVERVLKKDKKIKYVMKLDVKKFFPSVDHEKLMGLLARKIKDKNMLNLLGAIVESGGRGLPIGYYTSQWFSNFYLERVDHQIKEGLRARHYIRYADDMVILGTNKRALHRMKLSLDDSFGALALKLKDNWQVWKLHSRPLDFVGYRYKNGHTTVRKKIFFNLMRTVRIIAEHGLNIVHARRMNSLLGWFCHINFQRYYRKNIAPVVTKPAVRRYIARYDRKGRRARGARSRGAGARLSIA